MTIPPYTLCTFNFGELPEEYHQNYRTMLGLKRDTDSVLVLHEISNMPGHYAVATRAGKIVFGLHPENFTILSEEEV